jgi:hypothetical protein
MDDAMLQRLLAADDAKYFEYPRDFDRESLLDHIRSLRGGIEQLVGRALPLDEGFEDCSMCAQYAWFVPGPPPNNYTGIPNPQEAAFAATFSNFGGFFKVWATGRSRVPFVVLGEAIAFIESKGFVHLSDAMLDERYTGPFRFPNGEAPASWYERYFDWS